MAISHADTPDQGDAPVLDWIAARRNIPGGSDGVAKIAAMLVEECPGWIEEIRQGLAEGDASRVRRAVHTFRGAAMHFDARQVIAVAAAMEESAMASRLDSVKAALPRLESAADRLVRALGNPPRVEAEPPPRGAGGEVAP